MAKYGKADSLLRLPLVNLSIAGKTFTNIAALIFDKDGTLENSKVYLEKLTVARLQLLEAARATLSPKGSQNLGDNLARAFGFDRNQQKLDPGGLMAVGSRLENIIVTAGYLAAEGQAWFPSLNLARHCFDEADRRIVANRETCPMFAGVDATLKFWAEQGVKIAILSAARQGSVERFIADHQLGPWVAVARGSDQGLSKPDPALYQLTCQELGVEPQRTVMIGDAQGDIAMAKNAGAQGAIAIQWTGYDHGVLTGADATITDLGAIRLEASGSGS